MSKTLDRLASSADEIDRDLGAVLRHWQDAKANRGLPRSLGYEPRDIAEKGAVEIISRRVLKGASGFEEVDLEHSYEALVLKHPQRFTRSVVAAAELRATRGAQAARAFQAQEIKFLIKTSSLKLFGSSDVPQASKFWQSRLASIPAFVSEFSFGEHMMGNGFRSLVWLNETKRDEDHGKGLTAIVEFGPPDSNRRAEIIDTYFFPINVGNETLENHRGGDKLIGKIRRYNHSRIWPITSDTISILLSAIQRKRHQVSEYSRVADDAHDFSNVEMVEEKKSLRAVVVRQFQTAFRSSLLAERPAKCAITGTAVDAVLEAAHIVPYASKHPERDRPENGILLRRDIHKLFDEGLISIDPDSRRVCVSERLLATEYGAFNGKLVEDKLSPQCLRHRFDLRRD